MKKHNIVLWICFIFLLACRLVLKSGNFPYWFILAVITSCLSIFLIVKNKLPSKKYVIISVAFSILSTLAYLGYQQDPFILIYGLRAGIPTLLSSFAVLIFLIDSRIFSALGYSITFVQPIRRFGKAFSHSSSSSFQYHRA